VTKKLSALALFGALLPAATVGSHPIPPATGTISGTVTLEPPPPPRRTANRYSGASSGTKTIQELPAIVYLRGTITGSPPPGYVARPEMMQSDTAFAPPLVAVMVGGTVSFPNHDTFFHNVFSYSSPKRFDLGRYPAGESKDVVFDKPGVIQVSCEVHEIMRGAIVVTENPYHAIVAEDGTFSIDGVPPGEYTLVVWHADHDDFEQTVTVMDGGDTRVEVELRR